MKSTTNTRLAKQQPAELVRTASHDRRVPPTPDDDAPTRWLSLAHAVLNQAKMAAPHRAPASSSSSVPGIPPDPAPPSSRS